MHDSERNVPTRTSFALRWALADYEGVCERVVVPSEKYLAYCKALNLPRVPQLYVVNDDAMQKTKWADSQTRYSPYADVIIMTRSTYLQFSNEAAPSLANCHAANALGQAQLHQTMDRRKFLGSGAAVVGGVLGGTAGALSFRALLGTDKPDAWINWRKYMTMVGSFFSGCSAATHVQTAFDRMDLLRADGLAQELVPVREMVRLMGNALEEDLLARGMAKERHQLKNEFKQLAIEYDSTHDAPLNDENRHMAWLIFLAEAMKPKLLPKEKYKNLPTSYPSFAERVQALAPSAQAQADRS